MFPKIIDTNVFHTQLILTSIFIDFVGRNVGNVPFHPCRSLNYFDIFFVIFNTN